MKNYKCRNCIHFKKDKPFVTLTERININKCDKQDTMTYEDSICSEYVREIG